MIIFVLPGTEKYFVVVESDQKVAFVFDTQSLSLLLYKKVLKSYFNEKKEVSASKSVISFPKIKDY